MSGCEFLVGVGTKGECVQEVLNDKDLDVVAIAIQVLFSGSVGIILHLE